MNVRLKMKCIECKTEILEVTYENNLGYCGPCYNKEAFKDALAEANLSEEDAIALTKNHLNSSNKHKKISYKAQGAYYTPKWKHRKHIGGTWTVFFNYNLENLVRMDPDGFFINIDDQTRIIQSR